MLDTLTEAVEHIQQTNDKEMCIQLCSNCHEAIDSIHETLLGNTSSITNRKVFTQLDTCKTHITDLCQVIENNRTHQKDAEILLSKMRNLQIIFKEDVKTIYRIVFFAELGQKWNSMDSVYRAFKIRKDCEVKVVLTPVFRAVQTSDKVETDVIYEDYLTPMGIEYISYREYDITEDLPDMAFISNPYESTTLSQFWPENIAQYTRLVYLPYYTSMLNDSNSVKVNCDFPVAKHAWKIIAQSEKVKELHEKSAPKKGANVLVTGLPKWDELFLDNQVSTQLLQEWRMKFDGRKVFLWNSHYNVSSPWSTLLENGKSIVDLFSEKKDLALIWRPHPMTETIFKLYLPQYTSLWLELNEKVAEAENMVLDKNASSKMAFSYSDALISDYSSILAEYIPTGKPILWLQKDLEDNGNLWDQKSFVNFEAFEKASSFRESVEFIERITSGIDLNKDIRRQVQEKDMVSIDGMIGDKVCSLILNNLKKELR